MRKAAVWAAMLVGLASPAAAQVVDYSFVGTLAGGSDDDGIFGPFGQSLAGLPYRLDISIDFARGTTDPGAPFAYSIAGTGADSPLTVRLTVGGQPYQLQDFGITESRFSASDPLDAVDFAAGGSDYRFDYTSFNFDGFFNQLSYGRPGETANSFIATLGDAETSFALFGPAAVPGGVPEPATWALMVGGMAGLGVGLRGRRRPMRA